MNQGKQSYLGSALLIALMIGTAWFLLRQQSAAVLFQILSTIKPQYVILAFGLMVVYVGCEALSSHRVLGLLGHRTSLRQCMGYSFVGFYFSSVTPSATGGQPAQVYCMSRDGIPAAHGALDMLLISICYQLALLLYSFVAWLTLPDVRGVMTGGLGALLLFGSVMLIVLTAAMIAFMLLPRMSGGVCHGIVRFLARIGLVKNLSLSQANLNNQLNAYAQGAQCIRRRPTLMLELIGLALVQLTALFAVPYAVYLAFGLSGHGMAHILGLQALLKLSVCSLPLPGAVGASEAGFVRAFTLFFGSSLVTPAMLVSRGISFYAFLLIAAFVTLNVHLMLKKRARVAALAQLHRQNSGRTERMSTYLHSRV